MFNRTVRKSMNVTNKISHVGVSWTLDSFNRMLCFSFICHCDATRIAKEKYMLHTSDLLVTCDKCNNGHTYLGGAIYATVTFMIRRKNGI